MKNSIVVIGVLALHPGYGLAQAPSISVRPDSLSESLSSGTATTQILTIANNGLSNLNFTIQKYFINSSHPTYKRTNITYQRKKLATGLQSQSSGLSHTQRSGASYALPGTSVPIKDTGVYNSKRSFFGGLKILLISMRTTPDEIRDSLLVLSGIQQVDLLDASQGPVSIDQLLPYQTVIVTNTYSFNDPVNLGNVLADYVDAGGGLVLTVAAFASGWEVQGRLLDEGYCPFATGLGPAGSSSLGTFNQNHPIMRGVTDANGDYLADVQLADDAVLVASWKSGFPFVATKGPNVAAVNIYIARSGGWTGDIPLVLYNTAFWAGGCGWLSAEPEAGTVATGSSVDIAVNFDAAGLRGGEYNVSFLLSSNDPSTPEVRVPVHLHVSDAPALTVDKSTIDFGELFPGDSVHATLVVRNPGSEDLLISAASTDNPAYRVYPPFGVVHSEENESYMVTFAPTAEQMYAGTLTLLSNAVNNNPCVITLTGRGVRPPQATATPARFDVSIASGRSVKLTMQVQNSGFSNLRFTCYPPRSNGNYALEFNGYDAYLGCANNVSLNIRRSITLESWYYALDSITGHRILQKGAEGIPDNQYVLCGGQDYAFGLTGVTGGGLQGSWLPLNTWVHIAGVYDFDQRRITLYFDGRVIATQPACGEIDVTPTDLYVGVKEPGGPWGCNFWYGMLDEVRIWNVARTQEEIERFRFLKLTGKEQGLVADWSFDEGSGIVAKDNSPYGNHGTFVGGVTWVPSTAPVTSWVECSPDCDTVPPSGTANVQVSFDATGLHSGNYAGEIIIQTNDPAHKTIAVPYSLVITGVGVNGGELPAAFSLAQNYPNPFNPATMIRFSLPMRSHVKLNVFNTLGQEVALLVNEEKEAGYHEVRFDGSKLASGVYFYRMCAGPPSPTSGGVVERAGSFVDTKKFILLR
jgi:hypothetical protein